MATLSPAGFSLISLQFSSYNFHIFRYAKGVGEEEEEEECGEQLRVAAEASSALQTDIAF